MTFWQAIKYNLKPASLAVSTQFAVLIDIRDELKNIRILLESNKDL